MFLPEPAQQTPLVFCPATLQPCSPSATKCLLLMFLSRTTGAIKDSFLQSRVKDGNKLLRFEGGMGESATYICVSVIGSRICDNCVHYSPDQLKTPPSEPFLC